MENLIKRLQEEVGLTEDQAIKTLSVVKNYMDKEGLDIDWEKFFKGKAEDYLSKAKDLFDNLSKQTKEYTDKVVDKVDDLADKARKNAHDLGEKASDMFKDK